MNHWRFLFLVSVLCVQIFGWGFPTKAAAQQNANLADNVVRQIEFDICLPATAEEYEELGKFAILMLESESAISTELPLKSAYVMHNGVRIPLQKVFALDRQQKDDGAGVIQTSFYLLPIQIMRSDARLLADFRGERKEFGITTFSKSEGLDPAAPAFARLDAYNTPFDPDMKAVERVILREYPNYFEQ